jgi:hypothetical protein
MALIRTRDLCWKIGSIGALVVGLAFIFAGTAAADPWWAEEQGGTTASARLATNFRSGDEETRRHCAYFDGITYIGCPAFASARTGVAIQAEDQEVRHCAYYDGPVLIGCPRFESARTGTAMPGQANEANHCAYYNDLTYIGCPVP